MITNPIFLIGNPRSGTSLLRLMVSSHKNIFIAQEGGFLEYLYPKYSDFNGQFERIEEYISDLLETKKIENWVINKQAIQCFFEKKNPKNYSQLVSLVYEYYGNIHFKEKKRWGDKNNYFLHHINKINLLFPKAQYIHIVRDGRDVACSYKDMSKIKKTKYAPKLPKNIREIAVEWANNLSVINTSFDEIGRKKTAEIKYENLVCEPEKTLKHICNFLNEPYDERMLEYQKNDLAKEPESFNNWKYMLSKSLTKNRIKRWEEDLNRREIKLFESYAKDTLLRYDYKLANLL